MTSAAPKPPNCARLRAPMKATAREILVRLLRERPELIPSFLQRAAGVELEGALTLAAYEQADLLLVGGSPRFVLIEVLDERDDARRARWPQLITELAARYGAPGELLVLTASGKLARWAHRAVTQRGPLGTTLRLRPLVALVGLDLAEELLSDEHPEHAVFSAWATHHKHGPRSLHIARRALLLADRVDEPYRALHQQATLRVLPLSTLMDLISMTPDDLPESEAFAQFKQTLFTEAAAHGRAGALLRFLSLRGVALSDEQKEHIERCRDLSVVDAWVERVFAASTTGEMLEAIFG